VQKLTRIQHRSAGNLPPLNSSKITLSDGFDESERRLATGTYNKHRLQNWRQSFLGTFQPTDKRDIQTVNVDELVMDPIEESSSSTRLNRRRKFRRGKALSTRFSSLEVAKRGAREFTESSDELKPTQNAKKRR